MYWLWRNQATRLAPFSYIIFIMEYILLQVLKIYKAETERGFCTTLYEVKSGD